jgi:hypothetical protein
MTVIYLVPCKRQHQILTSNFNFLTGTSARNKRYNPVKDSIPVPINCPQNARIGQGLVDIVIPNSFCAEVHK